MSEYPIGATWKGEDKRTGKIAHIWLEERYEHFEVWRWAWCYRDGSRPWNSSDWGTSYRMCKEELPVNCRMKRIKKDD